MSDLDPYLPAAGDGLDVDPADVIADGEAWGFRLAHQEATGATILVDLRGGTDRVPLVIETEADGVSASAGVYLDADDLEALAATLLDAARHVDDGGDE